MRRAVTTLVTSVITTLAAAGPLTPPPGSVSPTGKTTDQLEPRTPITGPTNITQPGSYYLTGNITGLTSGSAITINVSDVTIDLNGFRLQGAPGSASGIDLRSNNRILIHSGTISGWGGDGIRGTTSDDCTFENLRLEDNAFSGIAVANSASIKGCVAQNNARSGFSVLQQASFDDCRAVNNTQNGYFANTFGRATNCYSRANGLRGFTLGNNSVIVNCVSELDATGINIGFNSVIRSCTVADSTSIGIRAFRSAIVESNVIAGSDSTGIEVGSECVIRVNNIRDVVDPSLSSGAGIRLVGSNNRIEDNHIAFSEIGVGSTTSGNLVIKNTFTNNNTPLSLVSGNRVGELIVPPSSGTSPASNPVGVGTSNPYVNFVY